MTQRREEADPCCTPGFGKATEVTEDRPSVLQEAVPAHSRAGEPEPEGQVQPLPALVNPAFLQWSRASLRAHTGRPRDGPPGPWHSELTLALDCPGHLSIFYLCVHLSLGKKDRKRRSWS